MSPIDAVMAFATITQFLGLFMDERKEQKNLRKEQFLDWLQTHRHEELKELICNTHHLSEQIDSILQSNHLQVLQELKTANQTLAQVMSRLNGFGRIVEIMLPEGKLPDFAMIALRNFEQSGETDMIAIDDHGVQFGNSGSIAHEDARFLSDDMDALEACGFIKPVAHHVGYSVYNLTRQGAAYVRTINLQETESACDKTPTDLK